MLIIKMDFIVYGVVVVIVVVVFTSLDYFQFFWTCVFFDKIVTKCKLVDI
jgi:hypothetical protein